MTDTFNGSLAGQAVSVMAGNSATVTPTVTTQSGRYGEFVSPTRRQEQYSHRQYQQQQLSRDVTFADVRTAQIAVLEVTQLRRGRWFDGRAPGEGDRCVR
ncbi:hypothetical protein [Escherichia coli]|uniref:hypothetical protein n=1 Tax=Escherichia coli TaxID=562 RepID=UPI0038906AC9